MPSALPTHVIFGAAGGIGSVLCRRLSKSGANLILAGRTPDSLTVLAAELGATAIQCDVTRLEQVSAVFELARNKHGQVDGVANCVGSILLKPAHITSEEEWDSVIATNLTSSFFILREAGKTMRQSGGSIVFVSSVAAQRGLANHEAIAAAKAGIIGLTLSGAASYAPYRIRVNCVAPGLVRTPLSAAITQSETAVKISTALHPLGRLGEPDDVAGAIEWFLNGAQSWITGQVLGVDGGMGSLQPRMSAA